MLLLSLDLSTTCTGWSVFEIETHKLLKYGTIKPSSKGLSKMKYPLQQLTKMIDIGNQVKELFNQFKPDYVVIEEIAGSKNRLGQKVLDGLHWIVLYINPDIIPIVTFYDVSGADGWRFHLKMKLTDADKLANKEAKKLNKELGKGVSKLPIIDWKDLAARHVNKKFGLNLNPQTSQFDADIADSVSIGDAYLDFKFTKK